MRAEFYPELRDVGAKAAKKNVDRLAKLTLIEAVDKLDAALDRVAQVFAAVPGNVPGPVAVTSTGEISGSRYGGEGTG